jgi:hypothetical protein
MRQTAEAPVGAGAARSGNKWSPGLSHGPTRVLLYVIHLLLTTLRSWRVVVRG